MKLTDEQLSDIFGLRMVVLLESEPQSNRYMQVSLSPEQFLELSNKFGEIMGEKVTDDGIPTGSYHLISDEIVLPDWVRDYYDS